MHLLGGLHRLPGLAGHSQAFSVGQRLFEFIIPRLCRLLLCKKVVQGLRVRHVLELLFDLVQVLLCAAAPYSRLLIPVVIPGAAIPAVGMPVEVPAEIPGAVIPAAEMPVVIPQQNKKRKNPFLKSADFRNGFFFL